MTSPPVITLETVEALRTGLAVLRDARGQHQSLALDGASDARFALACRDGFLLCRAAVYDHAPLAELWRYWSEAMERAVVALVVHGQLGRLHVDPITRRTAPLLSPVEHAALVQLVRPLRPPTRRVVDASTTRDPCWPLGAGYFVSPSLTLATGLAVAGAAVRILVAATDRPEAAGAAEEER
jgi:hypothetical protein